MTARALRLAARCHVHGALAAFILGFLPLAAQAWNGAGHRLVAAVAWERMKPAARAEASRLIHLHPEYARWLKRAGEADAERRTFIEAATWPDEIRKDKRFYSGGKDEPTPTLPGYPDMERRGNWHYVSIPLDGDADAMPLSGQIDRRLPELEQALSSGDEGARVYALPWLIHLLGDVHQPLHTAARRKADGSWDKLGSGQEVNNPDNTRKPLTTLHVFWDDLPGPSWLRGDKLDAAAEALMALHPRANQSLSSQRWIRESWLLAHDHGYPPGNGPVLEIDDAFLRDSREIADRRIVQAGYRLAGLLNKELPVRRPRPKAEPSQR